VIQKLDAEGQLTIRLAYNLFTQKPKGEAAKRSLTAKALRGCLGPASNRGKSAIYLATLVVTRARYSPGDSLNHRIQARKNVL
jgi:hypothetical protein